MALSLEQRMTGSFELLLANISDFKVSKRVVAEPINPVSAHNEKIDDRAAEAQKTSENMMSFYRSLGRNLTAKAEFKGSKYTVNYVDGSDSERFTITRVEKGLGHRATRVTEVACTYKNGAYSITGDQEILIDLQGSLSTFYTQVQNRHVVSEVQSVLGDKYDAAFATAAAAIFAGTDMPFSDEQQETLGKAYQERNDKATAILNNFAKKLYSMAESENRIGSPITGVLTIHRSGDGSQLTLNFINSVGLNDHITIAVNNGQTKFKKTQFNLLGDRSAVEAVQALHPWLNAI